MPILRALAATDQLDRSVIALASSSPLAEVREVVVLLLAEQERRDQEDEEGDTTRSIPDPEPEA